jgi:hypothetical protein
MAIKSLIKKAAFTKDLIPTGNYLSKDNSNAAGLTPHVLKLIGLRYCKM